MSLRPTRMMLLTATWMAGCHCESTDIADLDSDDPTGSSEILPDGRASMFYDHCAFEVPVDIAYEWLPSDEAGWLSLHPGAGETSLRYLSLDDVEALRIQLVEPCRELRFEIDGQPDPALHVIRPGASCWVDRCTTPNIMQVDYCEGEEPPPCP